MSLKEQEKAERIRGSLRVIEELAIPEHLQSTAFEYLLMSGEPRTKQTPGKSAAQSNPTSTHNLREYVAALNLKTAVVEIPALLYWAASNENAEEVDEKGLVELYRRAGLRPPKNIAQSLRDLASKKYGRLESVSGKPGFVRLSRVGEDFVIHDVIEKQKKAS